MERAKLNFIIISASAVCLLIGITFLALFRKVAAQGRSLPSDILTWISQLSVERYRPMERLLDEADFEFLRSRPGGGAKLARALRGERRRIFRGYLNSLSRDFSRVCSVVHILMLHSPHDRPDLASILLKQRLSFTLALLTVEWKLLLHGCGLGTVDVRRLVGALQVLRLEMNQLAQPAA